MRGTHARAKAQGSLGLHRFYMTVVMALIEWEEATKRGLQSGQIKDATVFMRYGAQLPTIPVATYSEMLAYLPETMRRLAATLVISTVASIESYIEEAVCEFFLACPAALCTKEKQITYEEAIKETQSGKLIDSLARKEAAAIAGTPFEHMLDRLEKRVGLNLATVPIDLAAISEVFETRHLLLHRGGIVDKRYLTRFPSSGFKLGELRPLPPQYLRDCLIGFDCLMVYLDSQIADKIFKATGQELPEYP